jgi:hypothetical protein
MLPSVNSGAREGTMRQLLLAVAALALLWTGTAEVMAQKSCTTTCNNNSGGGKTCTRTCY